VSLVMTKIRRRAIRLGAYGAIVLVSMLLAVVTQSSALGDWIEQRTYDLRFRFRGPLPALPDVPITIIAVDEQTFASIPDPLMLWHRHFARVITALADAGSGVIGVDFIFSDITRFDPDGQQALSESLLEAGGRSVPVVLAYRVTETGVEQPPEAVRLAALAIGHPLAFVNLTSDSDDFVRQQHLEAAAEGGQTEPGFALAVADAFAKKNNRIRKPVPTGSTLFINYRGPEHFELISFHSVLKAAENNDREYLRSHFGGRIALIGRVGQRGDEDFHSTPQYYWEGRGENSGTALRTPGIEIHGHAIATLLSGQFIQPLARLYQQLLTAFLIALVGALCFRLRPVTAVAASAAAVTLFLLGSVWAFNRGYAVGVVPPFVGAAMILGLSETTNFMLEGREKRRLRQIFKRYVNDQVIEQVVQSPDSLALQGKRRHITVLFADIRGYTTRSEKMPPESVVRDLNHYLRAMVEAIQSRNGMIDKFIGDGIMALFGVPLDDHNHTLHAVEAAKAMLEALDRLNKEIVEEGGEPIAIGIGIHAGEAVVGNIGSPQKMEYTAIGDVVNTAARIESLTRKLDANILISGDAFSAVEGKIAGEHKGEQSLKGKDVLVSIYKIG
jgi:adenylate cyclase